MTIGPSVVKSNSSTKLPNASGGSCGSSASSMGHHSPPMVPSPRQQDEAVDGVPPNGGSQEGPAIGATKKGATAATAAATGSGPSLAATAPTCTGKEQSSAARVAQARAEAARTSRSKVRQQRGVSTGPQQQQQLSGGVATQQESIGGPTVTTPSQSAAVTTTTTTVGRTRTLSPQAGGCQEQTKPIIQSRRWSEMTSDEDSEPTTSKLRKFEPPRRSFSSVVAGGPVKKAAACDAPTKVTRPGSPLKQPSGGSSSKGKLRTAPKSARGAKTSVADSPGVPISPGGSPKAPAVKPAADQSNAPVGRTVSPEVPLKLSGSGKKGSEASPSTSPTTKSAGVAIQATTAGTPASTSNGASSPKGSVAAVHSARGSSRATSTGSNSKKAAVPVAAKAATRRKFGDSKTSPRVKVRPEKRAEMETVPEEGEVDYGADSMETAHWGTMPPAGQFHPLPGFYPSGPVPPMMMFPPGFPAPYPGMPMIAPMLPQGFGPLMGNLPPYDHPIGGNETGERVPDGTPPKRNSKDNKDTTKGRSSKSSGNSSSHQQHQGGPTPAGHQLGPYQPQAHMYGHIRQHPTATIVYTTSPIPQDTTSIILVPMANGHQGGPPAVPMVGGYPLPQFDNGGSFIEGSDCPPPSPPVTHPPSGPQSLRSVRTHSVASEASFDGTRPVTVCIDRNVFKSWFDTDVPEFQQLRVKRYRTIDSFVHWMMKYCKRKSIYHGIFILIRVTEAEKLLDVLTRLIPTWHNVVMGIYV
ncbi:hypothetical protein FOZ61_007506 [Perkinsus olseni]|uniref:Uncharacterized protein n=1 Tax=Perkinsus olseni TaxID=32597 RepID=A0A7J6MA45_PEROL|nr:hypothetical protein FOL46_010013 [Perkinsus olseni]KAF4667901.1 hypothetical protein FOZ61_007506 [Perkinsus olseni]